MYQIRLRFFIFMWMAGCAIFPLAAQAASWAMTGSMPDGRSGHTATLLPDGKVLVAGGQSSNTVQLASAALYDPATGAWTPTGPLPEVRARHTATLLPNGKVLVAGGEYFSGSILDYRSSAVLYDPATGAWTATGAMPEGHAYHTATLLPSGKILVAGGYLASGSSTPNAALYDPATGVWAAIGPMSEPRTFHTATLLPNGKVLVAGGINQTGTAITLSSASLYNPATGTWTAAKDMGIRRFSHTATLLYNGKVLVAGGDSFQPSTTNIPLLYNPATDTWSETGQMVGMRSWHTATLLPDGKVLMAGGRAGGIRVDSAELYDPLAGTFAGTAPMLAARDTFTATLLSDGKVLAAGGADNSGSGIAGSEFYTPDPSAPNDSDFVVTGITLTPVAPLVNTTFAAKVTVKNQGKSAADGGKLRVWTNRATAPLCDSPSNRSVVVGTLAAGASATFNLTGLGAGAQAGVKTFRAYVDANCDTIESNDANNQRTLAYRVRAALPDFVVTGITLPATPPKSQSAFTATVTVKNQGSVDGVADYVDVWGNQPNTQPCGAVGDAWASVGALAAGATKTVTVNLRAGIAGTKTFRAFVNSWCDTAESDLTNNQQTQGYTVQ